MRVRFLGAAGTVTGSRFLVEAGRTRLLIDCGLFQGLKPLRLRNWEPPGFEPSALDAVLLTHAHLDHSGYLPLLVRRGFKGPVYCTPPTRDLCAILLADSGRIQEDDAEFANRKGFSRHRPALPLYTEADARDVPRRMKPVEPGRPRRVGEVEIRYAAAGHILGAASVLVRHGDRSVLFSGDLGPPDNPLLPAPAPPAGADWIVMESTYGDRPREGGDVIAALSAVLRRAVARGGVLLVPAFAVGRAQLILYCLEEIFSRGEVPRVPVYLDSPMATDVSRLYLEYHDHHRLSLEACATFLRAATFVRDREESKRLNRLEGPMVIVSASGMLTGGRILHHLKHRAHRAENVIFLPGFQAPGTRGAALAGGARQLKVHGSFVPVEAEVVQSDAFSAHADQTELLAWLEAAPRPPRGLFLVHGEPPAAEALRAVCGQRLGLDARIPQDGEAFDLA